MQVMKIQTVEGEMEKKMSNKKYALFLAARDSEYVKKIYGGYFNVFVDAFGDEGEDWDLFRVVDDEFPETEELEKYDGFVVSGSPYDAYGDEQWILKLCSLLRSLDAMKKRVLGICFGHQVLCRALGGKVGKAESGWDIGVRKIIILVNNLSSRFNMIHDFEEVPSFASIIECHRDEVWEVPIRAEVIAFSEKTGVEMFAIGEHILGIQGHPEYTKDILCNLIDRLNDMNSINEEFANEAKEKVEASEPDRKFWKKMCKAFLKRKITDLLDS